jgi:hypothetical protein
MANSIGEYLMPGSSDKGKSFIKTWFDQQNFKMILDVGLGWATYSKLLKKDSQKWDCVEIHEPYVNRFGLREHYETVYCSNILEWDWPKNYDVAIFGDVLEHMTKENAIAALAKAKLHSTYVIVSLPLDAETNASPGTGAADWNNPYEAHISQWSFDEFVAQLERLNYSLVVTERHPEIAVFIAKVAGEDH